MRLDQILRNYKAGFRHNPKQFYPNSFEVSTEGHRLVLVGIAKKYLGKRFRIVAILKPR